MPSPDANRITSAPAYGGDTANPHSAAHAPAAEAAAQRGDPKLRGNSSSPAVAPAAIAARSATRPPPLPAIPGGERRHHPFGGVVERGEPHQAHGRHRRRRRREDRPRPGPVFRAFRAAGPAGRRPGSDPGADDRRGHRERGRVDEQPRPDHRRRRRPGPPSANPATSPDLVGRLGDAVPEGEPGRAELGLTAIRADRNGPAPATRRSSPVRTPSGRPGTVIARTRTRQARSQVIITRRRGHRSAVHDGPGAGEHGGRADREHGSGVARGPGPVVDQDGEGDAGDLIAGDGGELGGPQRPVLGHRENVTVGHAGGHVSQGGHRVTVTRRGQRCH